MAGSFAAEGAIDVFQSLDQIADESARCLAARCFAEMRATAEGSRFVNLAKAVFEEGAGAIGACGHLFPAAGAPCLRGDHRLATGEIGRFPGELESTASRASRAVPAQWTCGQFRVDLPHLPQERGGVAIRFARCGGGWFYFHSV